MTQVNARSCRVSVAALMAASVLISVPATSVLALTPCPANSSNVVTPAGYSITAVVCGLNFPTAMTLQGDNIWVTEEGVTNPAPSDPLVKRIDNMGNVTIMLKASDLSPGTLVSPLTGIVFEDGWFYLVHRQTNSKNAPNVPVGVVSRFQGSTPAEVAKSFKTIIAGFPSFGDHPNSQIVFGADGR